MERITTVPMFIVPSMMRLLALVQRVTGLLHFSGLRLSSGQDVGMVVIYPSVRSSVMDELWLSFRLQGKTFCMNS